MLARLAFAALVGFAAAAPARAAFLIDPTGTVAPGIDGFRIELAGGPPPPPPIIVTVPLKANLSKLEKGIEIGKALTAAGVTATVLTGGTVRVTTGPGGAVVTEVIWRSGTHEPNDGILSESILPWLGFVGFTGDVTGQDGGGGPAVGSAGFEFDGMIASADLAAAGGPGTATDVWLTNVYLDIQADLPAGLQPFLSLDLATGRITYNSPTPSLNPRVFGGTTDAGLQSQIGMFAPAAVPEPASVALLAAGGLALLARRRRV